MFQQVLCPESVPVVVPAAGCPDWSLGLPEGGQKSCSATVQGRLAAGYACDIRCPAGANGMDFVIDPQLYICVYGGTWHPRSWVPDCTGGQLHLMSRFTTPDIVLYLCKCQCRLEPITVQHNVLASILG